MTEEFHFGKFGKQELNILLLDDKLLAHAL